MADQWVVLEPSDEADGWPYVYGPFDNKNLARAFASAFAFKIGKKCEVVQLNVVENQKREAT